MCVAIYKPKHVQLTKKILRQCFEENSDGAGFAYLDGGQTTIEKGYFAFGEFWKAYRGHMGKESIIHFRWATHGELNAENCHPFPLPDGALIHNGVIDWAAPKDILDTRSDTRAFTEDLLIDLLTQGLDLHSPAVQTMIGESIGRGNKLVMFQRGKHVIINESSGTWKHGAWFSNLMWERPHLSVIHPTHDTYYQYAYGSRQALGYGEEEDYRPWDEEEEDDHTSLKHIYARCEICGEWKSESGMVSIGAEKACPACWDHIHTSWDEDEYVADRVERCAYEG